MALRVTVRPVRLSATSTLTARHSGQRGARPRASSAMSILISRSPPMEAVRIAAEFKKRELQSPSLRRFHRSELLWWGGGLNDAPRVDLSQAHLQCRR